jgi:hypothetical protein
VSISPISISDNHLSWFMEEGNSSKKSFCYWQNFITTHLIGRDTILSVNSGRNWFPRLTPGEQDPDDPEPSGGEPEAERDAVEARHHDSPARVAVRQPAGQLMSPCRVFKDPRTVPISVKVWNLPSLKFAVWKVREFLDQPQVLNWQVKN